jgi:hypothetical protein
MVRSALVSFSILYATGAVLGDAALAQAPPNDEPASALLLFGDGCYPYFNTGATNSPVLPTCGVPTKDVWFYFVPTGTGTTTFTTCSAAGTGCGSITGIGDSIVAAFADAGGAPGAQLACSDDNCSGGPGLASLIAVPVTAGAGIFVSVAGYSGSEGAFVLDVLSGVGAPNDCASGALPMNLGVGAPLVTAGTNVGATTGGACSPLPSCGIPTQDVWYTFVAPITGGVEASFCATEGGDALGMVQEDTVLAAWDALTMTQLVCDDDSCGGGPEFSSRVSFDVVAGQQYLMQVASWGGNAAGTYNLGAAVYAIPANDTCGGATVIAEPTSTSLSLPAFTTAGASINTSATTCPGVVKDVCFQFTSNGKPHVCTVVACSPNKLTPIIRVSTGGAEKCCNTASWSNCTDDMYPQPTVNSLCKSSAAVTFDVAENSVYCISVGASDEKTGSFGVQLVYNVSGDYKNDTPITELYTFDAPPFWLLFRAMTLNAGAFPQGWWGGIDIAFSEMLMQANWPGGIPFLGLADAAGNLLHFSLPANAIPPGIDVYTSLLMMDPAFGFAAPQWGPPYHFTT